MIYSDGGAAIYTAGVVDGVLALDGAVSGAVLWLNRRLRSRRIQ